MNPYNDLIYQDNERLALQKRVYNCFCIVVKIDKCLESKSVLTINCCYSLLFLMTANFQISF